MLSGHVFSVVDAIKRGEGVRIRTRPVGVPTAGALGAVLRDLKVRLKPYPGDRNLLSAGFVHNEEKWPNLAMHEDPTELGAMKRVLGVLAKCADGLGYEHEQSQIKELHALASSILPDWIT